MMPPRSTTSGMSWWLFSPWMLMFVLWLLAMRWWKQRYSFDELLPPHFRSLLLMVIGLWLWTCNWFVLSRLGINMNQLLSNAATSDNVNRAPPERRLSLVGIARLLTIAFLIIVFLLHTLADDDPFPALARIGHVKNNTAGNSLNQSSSSSTSGSSVDSAATENGLWQFDGSMEVSSLLFLTLAACIFIILMPFNVLHLRERVAFRQAFCRIAFEGLKSHVSFADVLLADIFTSFSRIFGDLFLACCSIIIEDESQLFVSPKCSTSFLIYLSSGLPYFWRLRQCLADVNMSNGKNKVQLLNALKYASIFPVLLLNYCIAIGYGNLLGWSVLFGIINSSYSFFWDLVFDWDLCRRNSRYPYLRDRLLFSWSRITGFSLSSDYSEVPLNYSGSPSIYYTSIGFNFFSRFSWLFRLILIQLSIVSASPGQVFLLQLLELIRRFVWIFFRVENFTQHHSETIREAFKTQPVCIGIDEAGRGPVLGPMVYAIGFCPSSMHKQLKDKGMDDSKKLTAEQRQNLFTMANSPEWQEWFGWSVRVLSPQDISRAMLRRNKYNLNEISHDTAIMLIQSALERGVNVTEVYVDTVGPPEKYQEKLLTIFPTLKITVAKKADSLYPCVSAASICAKVARDEILERWQFVETCLQDTNLETLGCGYPSDSTTQRWLSDNIDYVFGFPNLIRFSWSTSAVILKKSAAAVAWECEEEDDDVENNKYAIKKKKTEENTLFKRLGAVNVSDF